MFSYFNGKNSGEKGTMMMMWEEKGNCKIMYTAAHNECICGVHGI